MQLRLHQFPVLTSCDLHAVPPVDPQPQVHAVPPVDSRSQAGETREESSTEPHAVPPHRRHFQVQEVIDEGFTEPQNGPFDAPGIFWMPQSTSSLRGGRPGFSFRP